MAMSAEDRKTVISRWVKPSSDHEKEQQDRAQRMVEDAVHAWGPLDDADFIVYTKGSYPNNTNVRQDSDVDVVVELQEAIYYDYAAGVQPANPPPSRYTGIWTPALWRAEVTAALTDAFDAESITRGTIAANIGAVEGSRPSADVVPSFAFHRYKDTARSITPDVGSCVHPSDGGLMVVNWPTQQLDNGRKKNSDTGKRYKYYVRALKHAENTLVSNGTISPLPSYFMECLVFNVPDPVLKSGGDLAGGFGLTLQHLWQELSNGNAQNGWVEPNWRKWLFKGTAKWTVKDAQALVLATWAYLGYGD